MAKANRIVPNSDMRHANAGVDIAALPPAQRLSVRGTAKGCREFAKSLGLTLPTKPGMTSQSGDKQMIWIGPDEWLIIDEGQTEYTASGLPSGEKGCAVTDISHRNTAFMVAGSGAVATLNAALPRDLSLLSYPVGTGGRTILGKAEIVLVRISETSFRVECWRSFAPYVFGLLQEGSRDSHL